MHPHRVRILSALLLSAAVFLVMLSPQIAYWWAQFGQLIVMPQGKGYMRWGTPQFYNLMFSAWNGLYSTHPMLLISTAGLLLYLWRSPDKLLPLALGGTLALAIYVNACVADWFGGSSFGSRRFCALVPIFAVGLGAAFSLFRKRLSVLPSAIIALCLVTNTLHLFFVQRAMGGVNVLQEIWELRQDLLPALPGLIVSGFLNSLAGTTAYALKDWRTPVLVLITIVAIVAMIFKAYRKDASARPRARGTVPMWIALLSAVGIAAILLSMAPPVNVHGQRLGRVIADHNTLPKETRIGELRKLMLEGYENPGLYAVAHGYFPDEFPLLPALRNAMRISPEFWAKWVQSIPSDKRIDKVREHSALLTRLPFSGLYDQRIQELSTAHRRSDKDGIRHAYLELLQYNPFDTGILQALIADARSRDDVALRRQYKKRLSRYLETKTNTWFRIAREAPDLAALSYFNDYRPLVAQRLDFLAANDRHNEALELCRAIETIGIADAGLKQRKAVSKALADGMKIRPEVLAMQLRDAAADSASYQQMSRSYGEMGNTTAALRLALEGLRIHSSSAELAHALNGALMATAPADIPLDEMRALKIDNSTYRLFLAQQLHRAARTKEAIPILKDLEIQEAANADALSCLGVILMAEGDYAGATERLRKAYAINPAFVPYGEFLIRALVKADRLEEAREVVREMVATHPADERVRILEREANP